MKYKVCLIAFALLQAFPSLSLARSSMTWKFSFEGYWDIDGRKMHITLKNGKEVVGQGAAREILKQVESSQDSLSLTEAEIKEFMEAIALAKVELSRLQLVEEKLIKGLATAANQQEKDSAIAQYQNSMNEIASKYSISMETVPVEDAVVEEKVEESLSL